MWWDSCLVLANLPMLGKQIYLEYMGTNRFSTETLESDVLESSVINSKLATRYTFGEVADRRREEFKQRLESVMTETMQKEAELLATIDVELTSLGLSPQRSDLIEPSEFLDFVLSGRVNLLGKSQKPLERNEGLRYKARSPLFSLQKETHSSPGLKAPSALAPLWVAKALESSAAENKYKVTDDYTVLFNESDAGEEPSYVVLGGDNLALCSFLAQRGFDIVHAEEHVLRELVEGKALAAFSELVTTIYQGKENAGTIIQEERDTYAQDLKQELSSLIENMTSTGSGEIDCPRLQEIFELYQHIPSRFKEAQHSLEPEFRALVEVKRGLTPENASTLNNFLEGNEELIFKVLGEDYFFKIQDKHDDFESAYREMFGYSGKEIWEIRNRNWENVNNYLTDEVATRGYLTVDDLRQIHILSTRGVLPFFCRGLRNDSNIGWCQAEHSKKTVTIGTEVNTTDVLDLDSSLEVLVSRANRIAKSGYPQIMAEVAWGNLFAEYATIHPHPDGNGTNAVFFIEAVKVLGGNYSPPERYKPTYIKRVTNTLNGNVLAMAVAYTRLTGYGMAHKTKKYEK